MTDNQGKAPAAAPRSGLDSFLARVRTRPPTSSGGVRGRLIFGLDATASRQPTWDAACELQAGMFQEVGTIGGLEMQLVFYRGLGECRASRWLSDSRHLAKTMSQIICNAGHTQLEKVLAHAQRETRLLKVSALAFVGDALEEDDDVLIPAAMELGDLGVPAFMFQEGHDDEVEHTFREIARLTKGAYGRFSPGAARQLAELLKAVAVFAVGGIRALEGRKDAGAVKLLGQLR
jgi:hypothetical protein